MPYLQPTMASLSNPSFDEQRWVVQIRRYLDEELEDNTDNPVNIFNVPKILLSTDPDSYVPQQVALGPYHYWRPELYEMERYKLAAAKSTQNQLQTLKFEDLVEQLTKHELRIRACYQKYLDFSGETLGWMMAVDASFLLEFLQVYAVKEPGVILRRVSSRMSHLVDVARTKSAHNAIVQDILMLENQIPLFILRKVLEIHFSSLDSADNMLLSMLTGLCKEISPFKVMEDITRAHVTEGDHVLGFMYDMIAPKLEVLHQNSDDEDDTHEEKERDGRSFPKSSYVKKLLGDLWKFLSKLNKGPVVSKPAKVGVNLPWNMVFRQHKEEKSENGNYLINSIDRPPLVEEISMPSVTELSKAGVCFVPTNGGIITISFDEDERTLYLPTICIDINTVVIVKNLVAYEACNASGPLVFARYTELINGIIDSGEDVKLLRERGIISNRLKSDEEVANLCNGMNKCVRLTKVPFLDKVIEDVNKFYEGRWSVRAGKILKVYVFGSWQFLTLLAGVMLLALTALQAFCSVYRCARTFHLDKME